MSDVTVEEDVTGPAGHARIRVRGAAQAQQSPGFMLRRPDWAEAVLGPAGWQVAEILLTPQRATVEGNDLVLLVGPEVCGHLEGGVYEIAVPAAGVEAPVCWPEIATPPPPPPPPPSPPLAPPAPPDATTILQRPNIQPTIVAPPPPVPPPPVPPPVPPPGPRWGVWAVVVLLLLAILGGALKVMHLYPFDTIPAGADKFADIQPPPAPPTPPHPTPPPAPPPPAPAPTPPAPPPPPPPAPPPPTPPPPTPPPPTPPPPAPPPPTPPPTPPPPPPPSPDSMSLRELMARNRPAEMYAQALRRMPTQPADALALLQRAGDDLHYGPALGALGQVYDPNKPPKAGVPSNARQAAQHYRDAIRAGQGSVTADRAALRVLLEIRQASGDAEARSILQEFWP